MRPPPPPRSPVVTPGWCVSPLCTLLIDANRIRSDRACNRSALQRAKPITLHFALVIGVLLYAFIGGVIFHALESGEHMRVQLTDEANKRECVRLILLDTSEAALTALSANSTAYKIVECWRQEDDMRTEWSYVTATLYGFGIVTTLGTKTIDAHIAVTFRAFRERERERVSKIFPFGRPI